MDDPQPLHLLLDGADDRVRTDLLDALRRRRVLGSVDAPGGPDWDVTATVWAREDRVLVVSYAGDRVTTGPSAEDLALQLSGSVGVSIGVHTADGEPLGMVEVEPAPDQPAPEEPPVPSAGPRQRSVAVVRGRLPVDAASAAEVARDLEVPLRLEPLPDGAGTLVVPESEPGGLGTWWKGQRPVLWLTAVDPGRLQLSTYLRGHLDHGGLRNRAAMRTVPGRTWVVAPRPTPVLDEDLLAALAPEDRERAAALQAWVGAETNPSELDDLGAELGLDPEQRTTLHTVLGRPATDRSVSDLVDGLGLPARVTDLLLGRAVDPAVEAVRAEPGGLRGVVASAALTPAAGDGWWARYQRIPHTRPVLAVLMTVLWGVLGAAALWWGLTTGSGWWRVAAVAAGVVLLVETVAELVVHRALARRRAAPPAYPG